MKAKTMYSAVWLIVGIVLLGTITVACADVTTNPAGSSPRETYGQAKRFEVEPFIGRHYFGGPQNLKDGFTYGGRLGYNFNDHFGVEGTLAAVNSSVDDVTLKGASRGRYRFPTGNVRLNYYSLDAIYHFTPLKRFSPFAVLGGTSFRYHPEMLGNNTDLVDYGVGVKYWMSKNVAIRADLRDFTGKSKHNYAATLGVSFAFGGKKHIAEPLAAKPEPIPEPKEVPVAPQEPMVEEKVVPAPPEEKTIVLVFEDVHFQFDKSTLTETAKQILHRNIRIMKDHPHTKIRIVGCASASGTDKYNQKLSERRAGSVYKYLVEEGGISPERLTTIGYGEHRPAMVETKPNNLLSKAALANMLVIFETIVN